MSNHHSRESINLHHSQVNEGKGRHEQRQVDRIQHYLEKSSEAWNDYKGMLAFGCLGVAYTTIGTAVYLGYIL